MCPVMELQNIQNKKEEDLKGKQQDWRLQWETDTILSMMAELAKKKTVRRDEIQDYKRPNSHTEYTKNYLPEMTMFQVIKRASESIKGVKFFRVFPVSLQNSATKQSQKFK